MCDPLSLAVGGLAAATVYGTSSGGGNSGSSGQAAQGLAGNAPIAPSSDTGAAASSDAAATQAKKAALASKGVQGSILTNQKDLLANKASTVAKTLLGQ